MSGLGYQRILLGVTGGISAYKSVELVRLLTGQGAEVRVVMTAAATRFVAPLTFQAISGNPVRTDLFDEAHEAAMGHIELARWADLILVAPASADYMARLAHGLADDLLTTLSLATASPLVLVPAMNQQMWRNQATAENVAILTGRGARLLGPAEGDQACGESGPGRMLEPAEILDHLLQGGEQGKFSAIKVLVTAGPTREALDPVRFIGNRSSGRMGFALAEAFSREGADVTLVSGPVALDTPAGIQRVDVVSAQEMYSTVMSLVDQVDVFVGCAAVADYRPEHVEDRKIKKTEEALELRLVKNPDILAQVAALGDPPFTLGFAAETQDMLKHAEKKRAAKGVDMMAANLVGDGLGFEVEENALHVVWSGGGRELPKQSKQQLAIQLMNLVAERFYA